MMWGWGTSVISAIKMITKLILAAPQAVGIKFIIEMETLVKTAVSQTHPIVLEQDALHVTDRLG